MTSVSADGVVLEMTDPGDLVPARERADLAVVPVGPREVSRFAALYRAIWAPIGGGGRRDWTDAEWAAELGQPGTTAVIATLGEREVGLAQIGWSGLGDAGFTVLGVVPALQGQGLGGDLLTRLTRHLWDTPAANGRRTDRVWLWTRPDEHPHAIPNYLARGFRRGPDLVDQNG